MPGQLVPNPGVPEKPARTRGRTPEEHAAGQLRRGAPERCRRSPAH